MKKFWAGIKIQVFLHLFAWAIILSLPVYIIKRWQVGNDFIWLYYVSNLINGIIFYVNYFILVPRFFFTSRKHRYYISVMLLIVFFYFVSNGSSELIFRNFTPDRRSEPRMGLRREEPGPKKPDQSQVVASTPGEERPQKPGTGPDRGPGPEGPRFLFGRPPFRQMHLFNFTFTSIFLVFFSTGLRVMERHSKTEKLQKELEKEKLNSELAFLKSQISPHFFFNTLNNIYSLISINSEDAQKAVLKLSKLMRYLLYESEHGNTRLSSEIEFMNNYIDLMKLRMTGKVNLSVSFPEKYEDVNIPPLLFIPFIENAFKHGISNREKSFIDIRMTSVDGSIAFRCANSVPRARENGESMHSGIGLENVTKRLNLLFPDRHDIKINKTVNEFEVLLQIKTA